MQREVLMNNFSGGVQFGEEPGEFTETQWKELDGFVFEAEGRLRTQWANHSVRSPDSELVHVADLAEFLLAIRENDIEYRELPQGGTPPGVGGWTTLAGLNFGGNPTPRPVLKVPFRIDGAGEWLEGLLLNRVDQSQPKAWILTTTGGSITAHEFTERFPGDTDTDDAMPHGNVGTMWGSFLVLGDIRWLDDEDSEIGPNNQVHYPYGMWFSQPDSVTNWDPIDVEFVSTTTGQGAIVGMFPLDVGLVVVAQDGVHLFRGNPDNYSYEIMRADVGCPNPNAVAYWPHIDAVVWLDAAGQLWHTNGDEILRLDAPLPPHEGEGLLVATWFDHLIVRRGGRTWVLHAFRDSGAWTSLRGVTIEDIHVVGVV